MFFHQLWPNTQKALGPTTSGGFIEVKNDWSDAQQLTNLSEVLLSPPPLFTELENCGVCGRYLTA